MKPIEVRSDFYIIAHRGASGYAPENTLPAFQLAREMGASHVEMDAQLSTDGVVVLCHDDNLARYGHGRVKVEKSSSELLLGLDMGRWFSDDFVGTKMLTLEELLAAFGDAFTYHVELKGKGDDLSRAVYDVVEGAGLMNHTIFISFSLEQLARMREISSDCRLGWLFSKPVPVPDIRRHVEELGLYQLCPRADAVSAEMVENGRLLVEKITTWGLATDPEKLEGPARKVVEAGCDAATIDWPDLLVPARL